MGNSITRWEKRFPGHGNKIMNILEYFYNVERCFNLGSAVDNLEELCQKAIFWRDISGIRIVSNDSLGENLWDTFYGSLEHNFRDNFEDDFCSKLDRSFWDSFGDSLGENLRSSLFYACGFAIIGDEDKDFQPLLALWHSGNLPVGFDKEGNLLVLCAGSID